MPHAQRSPKRVRGEPCPTCGRVHERCLAHKKRVNEPCMGKPMKGMEICSMHGGKAPQTQKAAERRLAEREIRAVLLSIGDPDPVDPAEELLHQLALAAANERLLRGIRETGTSLIDRGPLGAVQVAVVEQLWNEERDRVVKFAEVALRTGIEERRVRIAEELGGVIVTFVRNFIADPELGLDRDSQRIAMRVASRHLRLIDGTAA